MNVHDIIIPDEVHTYIEGQVEWSLTQMARRGFIDECKVRRNVREALKGAYQHIAAGWHEPDIIRIYSISWTQLEAMAQMVPALPVS